MKSTYTIGRQEDNDVIVEADHVSSQHAKLTCNSGKLVLEDQGSANGTWVNDRRISKCQVAPKDVIYLGKTRFDLSRYFIFDQKVNVIGTRLPDDFTDHFDKLEAIEQRYEETLDKISSKTGRYMVWFRVTIVLFAIATMSRVLMEDPKAAGLWIISIMAVLGGISVFLFFKAMQASRVKERQRNAARHRYKVQFCCPSCNYSIPDSASFIKMKDNYHCRYCKALLYDSKINKN